MKKVDNRLQVLLQGVVNKTFDNKLNSIKFEDSPLRKFQEATTSRWQVKKVTGAMLKDHKLTAPVETVAKEET